MTSCLKSTHGVYTICAGWLLVGGVSGLQLTGLVSQVGSARLVPEVAVCHFIWLDPN